MNEQAHIAYDEACEAEERERILMEQLPQVRYIARRIHERLPQHVPFDDLVHAGVLGLIDALHKYDRRKLVQFKSYAKHRIRGAILDSLRDMDWSPRDLRRKSRMLEEVHQRLGTELGRAANEQEIAEALHLSLDDLHHLLNELGGLEIGSMQQESFDDGKETDLAESLPANPDDNPFQACLDGEMKALLAQAISELPEKERQVLALYYYEELTMKEVGAVLGVGESRVSQIHTMAVSRLRARMQQKPSRAGAASRPRHYQTA